MHPFPCSALLTCFRNAHENTPFDQPNTSPLAMEEQKTEETSAVCQQPAARAASSLRQVEERGSEGMFKALWYSEKHCRTNSSSSNHTAVQPLSATTEPSVFAANELNHDAIALCTHIPRPSIIHVPKVSSLEVTVQQGKRIGSLKQSIKREKNPWKYLSCIDWNAVKMGCSYSNNTIWQILLSCAIIRSSGMFVIIPGIFTVLLIHKLLPIFYWFSLVLDLIQNPLTGTGIFFHWLEWMLHFCVFSRVSQNCNISGWRTLVFHLFFNLDVLGGSSKVLITALVNSVYSCLNE